LHPQTGHWHCCMYITILPTLNSYSTVDLKNWITEQQCTYIIIHNIKSVNAFFIMLHFIVIIKIRFVSFIVCACIGIWWIKIIIIIIISRVVYLFRSHGSYEVWINVFIETWKRSVKPELAARNQNTAMKYNIRRNQNLTNATELRSDCRT
jgi:hypothetical protein